MRTAHWETSAGALAALLNSGAPLNKCDLYQITLASGQVLRWTSAGTAVTAAGQVWQLGPGIERSQCKWTVGSEVDSLTLSLYTDAARPVTLSGLPLLAFLCNGGFDGASLQLLRAFWGVNDSGPVGTLLWFAGRVSEIPEVDRSSARIIIKSELERLNIKVPRQVYQAQCLATVYDIECGVDRAVFTASGSATGASTNGRTQFPSNLGQASGYFDLGTLTFTSGPNVGVSRTVKSQVGGALTLLSPLPAAVAAGHAFTIVPGCDGLQATCSGKFNNLLRFKGQPYIPQPETVT